ncbi:MAG: hypothetical protein K8R08_08660 [Methanosarcinales archaeon]|nr:hypothetical protein [Methanosarcinales archaeon]
MEKKIKYLISALVKPITFLAAAITIVFNKNILDSILIVHEKLEYYPFVSGVFVSWFCAFISILLILILANNNNKENYQKVFKNYEIKLIYLTMFILFYMAIHLASTAFGNITIPIFSQSYNRPDFFGNFSPQDVFLSLLAFSVVLLVFFIVPNKPNLQKKNIKIPSPKLARENKHYWLCFSWVKTPINLLTTFFIIFLMVSLIIIIPSPPEKQIDDVYTQTIEPDKSMFNVISFISFVILILFTYLFKNKLRDIEKIKGDFKNLIFFYSIIPAIIVATLVLSGNKLVEYPNFAGHIVVGILFISGFYTYITLITIYFSLDEKPYLILFYLALISFVAIFLFTSLFLVVCSEEIEENFRPILNFIVVMIILILIYSSFYEKLAKYQFTEWWKEWKPIAIIISIFVIFIVSTIKTECNIYGYMIPKYIIIILVLIFLIYLPRIIGLSKFKGKLPKYQGMVLVKAETSPDKLKKLKDTLILEDGLYNTKVIMGEYDLCLIIEGLDLDDIAKKVLKIRETEGVISTTTFIDINEFFDKEVR